MRGLSKTLETLIERATRKGVATKRVRGYNVMGGHNTGDTRMIQQWRVTVIDTEQDGISYRNVTLDHYGTEIAHIIQDKTNGVNALHNYYGESNSDRDALNGLMEHYGLPHGFNYRPSINEFSMTS